MFGSKLDDDLYTSRIFPNSIILVCISYAFFCIHYGFFPGAVFGWMPALILGVVAGVFWYPFILLGFIVGIFQFVFAFSGVGVWEPAVWIGSAAVIIYWLNRV